MPKSQLPMHSLDVASLHEVTPRHRIHYLVWRYPVYARSAGPASFLGSCADGRSCWLIRESPALTPGPHVPSSTVRHGDGRILAVRRALHRSRHASSLASTRFPHFLCRGQRARGSEPGVSIQMQAVPSMPVRKLAEGRLVQDTARRRAQTSALGRRYPSAVLFVQFGPEWSMVLSKSAR